MAHVARGIPDDGQAPAAAPPLEIAGAQRIVLSQIDGSLPATIVPLEDAVGLHLSEDVNAPRPHPPFAAAIKDGFAISTADGSRDREVVSASRAGVSAATQPTLSLGQAAYVTTSAPMPPGTDAVVQIESVVSLPEGTPATPDTRCIGIAKAPSSGAEVRAVGSDIPQGLQVLAAHQTMGAAEVGLLATLGVASVSVVRRPRLGVLSTGNELLDPLSSASASTGDLSGRIYDCNRPMLLAAARSEGCDATDMGIASDDEQALEGALDRALASGLDVLVCSGGVSMGDRDLVKPLLMRRGTVHYGKVRMKPGKPLTFATVPRESAARRGGSGAAGSPVDVSEPDAPPLLVFGLPGNPVSAFACFHLVVAPALRKLGGDRSPLPRRVPVTLASPMKMDPERPEYHRAVLSFGSVLSPASPPGGSGPEGANDKECGLLAHSTGGQISSRLLSCRGADALVELPMASGTLPVGTKASALLIGPIHRGSGRSADGLVAPLSPNVPDSVRGAPTGTAAGQATEPVPVPVPVPIRWWSRPRSLGAAGPPGASPPRPCRVGVLAHHRAVTPEGDAAGARRVALVLDVLGARLQPGSWLADVREVYGTGEGEGCGDGGGVGGGGGGGSGSGGGEGADGELSKRDAAAHVQRAAAVLCCEEEACSVLLLVAAEGLWGADVLRLASAELQPSRDVPGLGSLMRSACLTHMPGLALLGPWGASAYKGTVVLRLPSCLEAARACLEAALPCMAHAVAQAGLNAPPVMR